MRQHLQHMISLNSISKQWCSQFMLIGFRQDNDTEGYRDIGEW